MRKSILFIFLSVLISIISISTLAATIVVEAPAPKEVVVIPPGYIQCKVISAGFHHGRYIDKHRVCYTPRGHVQWISAHWECTKFSSSRKICRSWVWIPSYWKGKH